MAFSTGFFNHCIPFTYPCWLFSITFFTFLCPEMASKGRPFHCQIPVFPGTKSWLTRLLFLKSPRFYDECELVFLQLSRLPLILFFWRWCGAASQWCGQAIRCIRSDLTALYDSIFLDSVPFHCSLFPFWILSLSRKTRDLVVKTEAKKILTILHSFHGLDIVSVFFLLALSLLLPPVYCIFTQELSCVFPVESNLVPWYICSFSWISK